MSEKQDDEITYNSDTMGEESHYEKVTQIPFQP